MELHVCYFHWCLRFFANMFVSCVNNLIFNSHMEPANSDSSACTRIAHTRFIGHYDIENINICKKSLFNPFYPGCFKKFLHLMQILVKPAYERVFQGDDAVYSALQEISLA
jgi:hypothetical protein